MPDIRHSSDVDRMSTVRTSRKPNKLRMHRRGTNRRRRQNRTPGENNRGHCMVDQEIWERGPRLPIKIMSRRPATGSVTSKGPKSARSIAGLYRSIDFERSAACSTDLPFLVATACLDLAADKGVAFGSCQCRLMIFVSTGGTIAGAGGTSASAGCDAVAWVEVS